MFWIIVILIISSAFRILNLDLIEFKYDEAYTVFQMEQFFAAPYLMQVGPPQSTGVYNPPLFNYLMIILSLFTRHPQTLTFFIALINVAFVGVFYLIIRKFYGNFIAVISGLLLATSPWSIIFSRKIWIPDLLGPMMVALFYFLHQVCVAKKANGVLPLFVFLASIPQMHASGLFFTIATVIILFALKVKIDLKQAGRGFLLGLIPATPYFIRQLTSNPFCIDCVSFLSYQSGVRSFDPGNFTQSFNFLGGYNFQILLGQNYNEFLSSLPFPYLFSALFYLQLLTVLITVFWIIKNKREYLFLPLYLLIVPALYFLTRTPPYMHYFVVLSLPVILIQALFFKFFKFKAIAVIIIISNTLFMIFFYQFLSSKKAVQGDYGPIYKITEQQIQGQIEQYKFLPDYDLLKSYTYMFAQSGLTHQKLGDYFLQTNRPDLAVTEFEQSLKNNPKDIYSLANLSYIYSLSSKDEEANKYLQMLEIQDATAAAKLKSLIKR